MSNRNNIYLAAFLIGISYFCASPNYASDETAIERMSHHPIMFSSTPVITYYKVTYHRHNDDTQEQMEEIFQDTNNTSDFDPQDIKHFIQSGIKKYPLPADQSLLLEDLAWHKEKDRITKAISSAVVDKDLASISYLGSIYAGIDEYENAKPWLFYAASKDDSTAFWLLSTMQHAENLLLHSKDLAILEQKLLEKSADLGNVFALEALGPNYKK